MLKLKKLYLTDPCTDLDVRFYINEKSKKIDPEIYREMDFEFHKVLDKALKKTLGKNWEEITDKYKDHITRVSYKVPDAEIFLLMSSYRTWVSYQYSSPRLYPYVKDLQDQFTLGDRKRLANLLMEIFKSRNKIFEELVSYGVLSDTGLLLPETFREIKDRYPDIFEWYIERDILKYGIDRVVVVTEEEDLKNLREWIPSVMI